MPDLLFIRADASPQMGTGHVMRCLALAEQWLYGGGSVMLLSAELPAPLAQRAADLGVKVIGQPIIAGSKADARQTGVTARAHGASWVMVDGYQFDAAYQRELKDAGLRLLWVDDFGHADEYCAELVLNQNLGATPSLYPKMASETQLLLGCRYVLLRREFLRWQSWQRDIPERAGSVLVTLGGSDPANVTAKVVHALRELGRQAPAATIVVGGGNPHYASHRMALHDTPHRLVRNAANMPELMAQADVAIAAGGTTAWELAFMGLPSLMFILADNQSANCEELARRGAAINLGRPETVSVADLARAIAGLANDAAGRRRLAQNARALVDGYGSLRVWLHTHEDTLKLRPATEADCRMIFEWANAPDVRAVSFDSAPIPWETHVRWFRQKLTDPQVKFWLASEGAGQPMGVARFELAGAEAAISVSLAATARGRNRGTLLIWTACRRLFREQPELARVLAWIKPDNEPSKRAFRKAGFAEAAQKEVKGQPALVYELGRA